MLRIGLVVPFNVSENSRCCPTHCNAFFVNTLQNVLDDWIVELPTICIMHLNLIIFCL